MEKETSQNNKHYMNSRLYARLLEFSPEDFEFRLEDFVKVARSSRPEEILHMIDVLTAFVYQDSQPSVNEKIVETLVDGLFGVLEYRDSVKVKGLLSDEYSVVVSNLEKIKEKFDSEMVCKIEGLYEKDFYPSVKTELDS